MVDLNKYSVQGTQKPRDLSQYGVASTAPTLSQISSASQLKTLPEDASLMGKLGKRLGQVGTAIKGEQYPAQPIIGTAGAVGGAVNDIIGAVINPFITKTVDTLSESPTLQKIASSKVGSQALDTVNTGISSGITKAQEFEQTNPNIAQFGKDVFNASSLIPVGAGAKEGSLIARDTIQVAKNTLRPSEATVQTKVLEMFNKAVKPTAKKTNATAERFDNNVITAIKEIKDNTPNLNIEDATGELVSRAPQSLNELSQALEQTKTSIFKKYNDLAVKTNETGATLKVENIVKELQSVFANKAINLTSPEVVNYAKTWSDRLSDMGDIDIETAQEVVKLMNKNLESFYKNPTYESASKAAIDAGIVNNLRKELDEVIEGATGEGYQALKSAYGSLKAIENDVVRASMRDGRKNTKGLLDYTDMFTGGQMVGGILSLNPAMFTKGAIERGFKEYIKYLNDPNRIIKGMFDALDKPADFVPQSRTGTYLKNKAAAGDIGVGLSTKAVITPDQKLQIAKELESYDITPATVNGKIDLNNSDIEFRISELQEKNKSGKFTDADAIEARSLLEKRGINFD